jgi:triosephosphate isomerase
MKRVPIIAGNWKMHCLRSDAQALASGVAAKVAGSSVEVVLCPTATALDVVVAAVKDSGVGVGAQNCHAESKGAFTGEIAVAMLAETGAKYIIVGHSERRQYYGETDGAIAQKVKAILAAGLTPIVCVGEILEERQANKTLEVVGTQVRGCLGGLDANSLKKVVVAYEPVWAIGTGLTASPEQAQEVHRAIRELLAEIGGAEAAEAVRIQYGGSVKPDNARELLGMPDIDGALVGGASLKVEDFAAIVAAAE